MNQVNHLCESWQVFLQRIMDFVSTGHYYHHAHVQPEKRRGKLANIDKKIIERFETTISKDQRYRRKKKNLVNYVYLRWELTLIILKTDGEDSCEERSTQKFHHIRDTPLEITIGSELQLKLTKEEMTKAKDKQKRKQGYTYYLTKQCYRNIKAALLEDVEHRRKDAVIYRFNALNNIPAYAGIIKHKKLLKKVVLNAGKKHGMKFEDSDLVVSTKLYKYKNSLS